MAKVEDNRSGLRKINDGINRGLCVFAGIGTALADSGRMAADVIDGITDVPVNMHDAVTAYASGEEKPPHTPEMEVAEGIIDDAINAANTAFHNKAQEKEVEVEMVDEDGALPC